TWMVLAGWLSDSKHMKATAAADRLFSSWPSSKDGPRTRKVRCLAANLKGGLRHRRIAQDKMGSSEAGLGQRPRKRITQHVDAGGRRLVKHCRGEHASRSSARGERARAAQALEAAKEGAHAAAPRRWLRRQSISGSAVRIASSTMRDERAPHRSTRSISTNGLGACDQSQGPSGAGEGGTVAISRQVRDNEGIACELRSDEPPCTATSRFEKPGKTA